MVLENSKNDVMISTGKGMERLFPARDKGGHAMAMIKRRVEVTPEQVKKWVLADLANPKAAAELKSRSDEADAKMRAKGLLSTK